MNLRTARSLRKSAVKQIIQHKEEHLQYNRLITTLEWFGAEFDKNASIEELQALVDAETILHKERTAELGKKTLELFRITRDPKWAIWPVDHWRNREDELDKAIVDAKRIEKKRAHLYTLTNSERWSPDSILTKLFTEAEIDVELARALEKEKTRKIDEERWHRIWKMQSYGCKKIPDNPLDEDVETAYAEYKKTPWWKRVLNG